MPKLLLGALTGLFTLLLLAFVHLVAAPAGDTGNKLEIPKSLQLEHAAIHASLAEATRAVHQG